MLESLLSHQEISKIPQSSLFPQRQNKALYSTGIRLVSVSAAVISALFYVGGNGDRNGEGNSGEVRKFTARMWQRERDRK